MDITKRQARLALGFTKDIELARFFHVGKSGVSIWQEDAPLPRGRQWELIARRPDLFAPPVWCAADVQPEERRLGGGAVARLAGSDCDADWGGGSMGKRFA